MNLVKIKCSFCSKEFFRTQGRVNEAKKFGWKYYCSSKCQNLNRNKQKSFKCGNPSCNKIFKRTPCKIPPSKICFCSSHCTAIVNNSLRKKIKICSICGKKFSGERKYCSRPCYSKAVNRRKKSKIEKQKEILKRIKTFYKIEGRIPTKKEKPGLARSAQDIFETWNEAIKTAGFKPNPVMFAKKYIANDGHKCDSFSEKIIDDWLYLRKIQHKRNVPYPENSSLIADFVTKNEWIEFFGLAGEIKEYDKILKIKQALARKYQLPLLEIYPRDLFPVNKLATILNN